MLRKAKSEPRWMQLFDVPHYAAAKIAAAFGDDRLRYDRDSETLSLPSRMRGVTWEQYDTLLKALPEHRLRHTYDRGFFEMMSPSDKHEKLSYVIGRFVEEISRSIGVRIECFGRATRGRRSLRRGLEPDETYFIANEPAMRGRFDYRPERDPPPDFVIEVDLRRPSKRRMRIYAALQVPEVWEYGKATRFFAPDANRNCHEIEHSLSFPFVGPKDIDRFLARLPNEPTDDVIFSFGKWAKAEHKKTISRNQRKKKSQ